MDDIHSWWEVPSIAHFCSLFRVSFDLLDFDIEDLEAALLTDGTEDNGNSLLQELIARLLSGCFGNNSISTFNYQMFLRRLFREKCKEYNLKNPFNSDIDFQFLPLRTKVEILHTLCDFRLDADDVMESLKNLDSDSLRVHPLGYDENKSAYWYFYGTRLYKEDYEKVIRNKKKKKKRGRKKKGEPLCSDTDEEEVDMGSGKWQVICFTESDWERLALKTEDSENRDVRALHQVITEDFLPEIPRLFEEKERLQRKRLLEMQPRRQSTRLEKLKQQKEERKKYEDLCQEHEDGLKKKGLKKKNLERPNKTKERPYSDSENESHGYSSSSSRKTGRQTNNSLASATGQIVIEASKERKSKNMGSEDLQIGMYKILNKLKDHEDAWPFLEPVDEEIAPSYYRVVKTPMDLQQMEDKLNDGLYKTFNQFKHDFQLIIANCKQYNGSTNEYTVMCGNLQRVFNMGVHKYLDWELSDGSDDEMAYLKRYENGTMRSRKSRNRQRSTSSKESSNNTDKENEEKLQDCSDSSNKFDSLIQQTDEDSCSLDSKVETKKKSVKEFVKSKKNTVVKNTNAVEVQALEEVTEQTLRDINKWLDDTPNFSSASNSPIATLGGSVLDDAEVTSRLDAEYRQAHKLDKPRLLFKEKKRPSKEPIGLPVKKKREVQRTIDRLQPGKSKGNLISNKQEDSQTISKHKAIKSDLETVPTLSLGTVLNTDLMGFSSKVSYEDKDLEKMEVECEKSPEENYNVFKKEENKSELEVKDDKPEKTTPNLSAWFKAFGAPKTQPTPKRKQEVNESSPIYTAYAMNDMVPYDYTLKESDKKDTIVQADKKTTTTTTTTPLVSPDKPIAKRQRKTSTGSSVSEQSSQNDSWNSPRPSLDEPYLSPQSVINSPQQLKPYQNVLNIPHAPLKVGFYQDAFARPNSEKSSSCSPRNPSSVMTASPHGQSPRNTFTSPRELPSDSPSNNFIGSPHEASCSPHNNVINSPKESPHHLILSPQDSSNSPYYSPHNVVNSPKEPVANLADEYQQNQNVYPQYIGTQNSSQNSPQNTYTELYPQPIVNTAIKTQNIFPVKKRMYNESERSQEMAFTPTIASKEQERVFVPAPGQMPNSNFNSDLSYPMGYPPRNDQPLPSAYQQSLDHQLPPVSYQNSLNYLQIARDRTESEPKNVPNSLFNYSTQNHSTFVSAPHYTSTPLNYSNHSKDSLGYTSAPLNYASRTTPGQFMPPNFKQAAPQPRLNYSNPYDQYPKQINLRPYNYVLPPGKSYSHPIQDMIPGKTQNIDFTTGRPLSNMIPPTNIDYRYNQPGYTGLSVNDIMKNSKLDMNQPTYSNASMAEMIKVSQAAYTNTVMTDVMKVSQPTYSSPSVAEMTKSKMEMNRSMMMEQGPPSKPAKKTGRKKKTVAVTQPPPEPSRTIEPSHNNSTYPHHYQPLVKPQMSAGHFNFNPAVKEGYQDYLNEMRSTGYFADQAASAAVAAAATQQPTDRNPAFAAFRPQSSYAPPIEAFNPNPSDIYSQFLQRHPMMLHQGLTGFPPGYLNMHDPMNRHPPWM
ncbi:bromodomain-containing protein 4-like isoform X2 [Daktulosphaira vitifoliae]|uniref:bromodomain-containing protein 4-like isoform X2 n=1 Tax=Daktulosphaira vitifoliae TaxID=58002 RepID=UPI0021A9ED8E|nr:bromodomain-containing protein 4-like isoform X2 [Daktulosphaira vitifoliae]